MSNSFKQEKGKSCVFVLGFGLIFVDFDLTGFSGLKVGVKVLKSAKCIVNKAHCRVSRTAAAIYVFLRFKTASKTYNNALFSICLGQLNMLYTICIVCLQYV